MGNRYAVLGAGRAGTAAGYDMAKFGEADRVLMIDSDSASAQQSAKRINSLIESDIASSEHLDVSNSKELLSALDGVTSILSAVPYSFNPKITEVALELGANMCDLGGHTGIVRKQLESDSRAKDAGISIIPDCGMGPGMNISLAVYAMSLLDEANEVLIWDGGLPQDPIQPWNYLLTFNIGGLTNEYYGSAYFLRDGKVTEVPCFEGYEVLGFPPPIGFLEAFVTSGGLSTAPWTFEGKLQRLENKTLRYPGHCAQFKAYSQLGLLELESIKVGEIEVAPRDVFHSLLEPRITKPEIKDIGIIKIKGSGMKAGQSADVMVELIDYYDEETEFTAMERLTGWHASIVAILAAKGKIERGARPVELAVPGDMIVEEAEKRGFNIDYRVALK
jgi:lysine 6-dehydrogenase